MDVYYERREKGRKRKVVHTQGHECIVNVHVVVCIGTNAGVNVENCKERNLFLHATGSGI